MPLMAQKSDLDLYSWQDIPIVRILCEYNCPAFLVDVDHGQLMHFREPVAYLYADSPDTDRRNCLKFLSTLKTLLSARFKADLIRTRAEEKCPWNRAGFV